MYSFMSGIFIPYFIQWHVTTFCSFFSLWVAPNLGLYEECFCEKFYMTFSEHENISINVYLLQEWNKVGLWEYTYVSNLGRHYQFPKTVVSVISLKFDVKIDII